MLFACKPTPPPATDTPPTVPPTIVVPPTPPVPVPTAHTGSTASTADTGSGGTADTSPFLITCDSADTGSIGVPDCNGRCYPQAFIGDGFVCDDGTPRPWGNPDFDCAAFGFDEGDCVGATGSTAATGDTG